MAFLSTKNLKFENQESTDSTATLIGEKHKKGALNMSLQTHRADLFSKNKRKRLQSNVAYDPKFEFIRARLNRGLVELERSIDRTNLPSGKVPTQPNIVKTPSDFGLSVNSVHVIGAHNKLGHVKQKKLVPNFCRTQARDLGFYRETERIFNVIRENETLEKQYMSALSCFKDSTTQADTLAVDYSTLRPGSAAISGRS